MTFSPLAWLKLLMFLHAGDTEVGGFAISSAKQALYLEDFVTVKQTVTAVTVAFDDTAVADFFDECIDRGLSPARFARVWVHTHPGQSPEPSSVDEETFARVFGSCDWAVMLIVSRTHATYARVAFNAGPGGSILLPVTVDWAEWPQTLLDRGGELGPVFEAWMDEYGRNICYGKNICPAPLSADWGLSPDSRSVRDARINDPWREEEIYLSQEQDRFDEAFADYYETAFMEQR